MADAFIAAVAYIGSAIGGTAGATFVIYAVEIGTALYFAAAIAVSTSYSNAQRRRAERSARDAYNASLQDRLIMTSLAGGQRSRVYGRVRNVEGVLFKATSGANNENYTLVVSVAGHEVDAIEQVYFDDVQLTLDASGYVQDQPWRRLERKTERVVGALGPGVQNIVLGNPPEAGSVSVAVSSGAGPDAEYIVLPSSVLGSTVTFTGLSYGDPPIVTYQWVRATPKARIRKFLGGPSQDLSGILQPLFPALLTSSDKFAGDACLLVELTFDQNAFPTGVPQVSARMRGARVYDPRTGFTIWSENPALIANDWAQYEFGGNCSLATVNQPDVIAAANACDTLHTFATPTTSTTRPLYSCGIVCRTDQDPSQSLDEIVESMAGRSGWSGGVLRMRAGVYRAPVDTITEDWLSGTDAITVVPEVPIDDAINIVRATISDMGQDYVVAAMPDVRATAYITADGRELPQDLTFGGVTDNVHVQHIAGVILREARSGLTVTLPCNWRAFRLELFDVVNVTLPRFGWVSKLFEVAEWKFSLTGGIILVLRETAASIFDPDALFSDVDATPNTQLADPFAVPVPAGLALASGTTWLLRQDDGSVTSRLHVSWTPITDLPVLEGGGIEVRYGLATSPESSWTSIDVPGGDSEVNLTGIRDGGLYVVKLRARNALVQGDWCVQKTHLVIGKTAPPVNVAGLASTIVQTGARITWTKNTEVDYSNTELRVGASWAAGSLLFKGDANTYTWLSPAIGTYTVWARHYDTTGNESITAASIGVVIDASAAIQWSSITGAGKPQDNANLGAAGGYVNTDPMLLAPAEWTFGPPGSGSANAAYYQNFNGGNGLTSAWDKTGGRSQEIYSARFPISEFKTYFVESSLYMWAANTATHYFLVAFYKADGTLLDGTTYPTGWPSAGTYHYYGLTGTGQAAGASRYSIAFGKLATAKIPAGAAYAKVGFLGCYNNTTDRWSWGGAQLREVAETATIAPGAVTTLQVQAQAITVGGVVTTATTVGGSVVAGSVTASSFFVGPSIVLAVGDDIVIDFHGTHIQRLFNNSALAKIDVHIEIDNGGAPITIGVNRKYMQPFAAAGVDTNLPIYCAAQATPGAGTWNVFVWYTVTCLDSAGATISNLKDYSADGEFRTRRIKR